MITQYHKTLSIDASDTNTYFVIANSEKEMYEEVNRFVKEHKTDSNAIWVSYIGVKPNKINLRPEWSAELEICEKYDGLIHLFQQQLW